MRLSWVILPLWIAAPATAAGGGPPTPQKHWAYRSPARHDVPSTQDSDWARSPVDRFVLKRLEDAALRPAPEAPRRALIRRLSFDLIGLPPTPEDIERFVTDPSPDAYERLVDRLLASPHHGERWARPWLDLARYADSAGYEGDPDTPWAWRYRDYVIDSFNRDKPFDLFVREQIAGDELKDIMGAGEPPIPAGEQTVALTFLRLAPFTEPRGDETRHELLSEMTSTVSSVFLGLTVGCAKCHDHKYDEIPMRDFYRMKAFFATVQIAPPERGDIYQIGGPQPAEHYLEGQAEWAASQRERTRKARDAANKEIALLKAREKDENNAAPLSAEERARLAELRRRLRTLTRRLKRLEPLAMSLRHSFGPPFEPGVPTSRVMVRGEWDKPGEAVEPGFPRALSGNQRPAKIRLDPFRRWPTRSRRKALADWIASRDNPLTARVAVNRLWQHHFGRGIVGTPSDFGKLGTPPTHPKLLDWLALRLIDSGWSLKTVHRALVNSSSYRQASRHESPEAAEVDPGNDLLWRFRRLRLSAEAIRDSVLAVSGRITLEVFGLPVFPVMPDGVEEAVKYTTSKWDAEGGAEGRRRSVYIYQQRTLNMPFLDVFDAKVADVSCDFRQTSVTALQALEMYNGDLVSAEAPHFANRVQAQAGDRVEDQVRCAFELALGRSPEKSELSQLSRLVSESENRRSGLVGLCRVIFNTNEFVYVD